MDPSSEVIRNLLAGWFGMLGGVLTGALIGLFFHREGWLGGYGSFRRRLVRLGHISFFGLGFINFFFGLTAAPLALSGTLLSVASYSLIVAAVTMPACCFASAWREPFRRLFFIPVSSAAVGILSILAGHLSG